jgi:hypothetical protein
MSISDVESAAGLRNCKKVVNCYGPFLGAELERNIAVHRIGEAQFALLRQEENSSGDKGFCAGANAIQSIRRRRKRAPNIPPSEAAFIDDIFTAYHGKAASRRFCLVHGVGDIVLYEVDGVCYLCRSHSLLSFG